LLFRAEKITSSLSYGKGGDLRAIAYFDDSREHKVSEISSNWWKTGRFDFYGVFHSWNLKKFHGSKRGRCIQAREDFTCRMGHDLSGESRPNHLHKKGDDSLLLRDKAWS